MKTSTAFVVGFIDTKTNEFKGFSIFSEASPTIESRYLTFVALTGRGESFAEGLKQLAQLLSSAHDKRTIWIKTNLDTRAVTALQSVA